MKMQKLSLCLCFDDKAKEACDFYTSIIKDSKILNVKYYSEKELKDLSRLPEDIRPKPIDNVQIVTLELLGQKVVAVNGGSFFKFSEGISLVVNCETQDEIDELYEKLSEGGKKQDCGWLQDKFGVSWQIIPDFLNDMVNDPNQKKAEKVMRELFKMKKVDIVTLKKAYELNI